MLCGGKAVDPHIPKRGDCVKKRLKTTGLDYVEKFISVSLYHSKTRPANSEKNVDFNSSKSSEYAATDTSTSTETGIENENILRQCNDEIRTARTFATFFSYIGHKLFHVLSIYCSNVAT